MGKKIKRSSENLEEQFTEVLQQIQRAKQKAFQQVNKVLVELYWNIGSYVFTRVNQAGWGKSTVAVTVHAIPIPQTRTAIPTSPLSTSF